MSEEVEFKLSVSNPCPVATLKAPYVDTVQLKVGAQAVTVSIPDFLSSVSSKYCGNWTIQFKNNFNQPLDPSIFKISSDKKLLTLQTNDSTKVNLSPFTVNVVGY